MRLKWKYFSRASELIEYIEKCHIKREDIQGIFLTSNDHYELFYWERDIKYEFYEVSYEEGIMVL